MASLYAPGSVVSVRALLLGERINLKGLEATQRLATNPLLISAGEGQYAALFRYGAVVLFGVNPLQEVTFVDQLAPLVGQPYPKSEAGRRGARRGRPGEDRVEGGEIVLHEVTVEALQVIADVLAKSVVLGYYEMRLAGVFDPIEPLAPTLQRPARRAAAKRPDASRRRRARHAAQDGRPRRDRRAARPAVGASRARPALRPPRRRVRDRGAPPRARSQARRHLAHGRDRPGPRPEHAPCASSGTSWC